MTEQEWLTGVNPAVMVAHFLLKRHNAVSERKLRLFACGCCRLVWHLLTDERSRHAVEVAERYVDGLDAESDLAAAHKAAFAPDFADYDPRSWARACVILPEHFGRPEHWLRFFDPRHAPAQAALLRCVFGNPWLTLLDLARLTTPSILSVAQAAYDERVAPGMLDPARLAVLADALEEADCPTEIEEVCDLCKGAGVIEDAIGTDWPCVKCSHGGQWAGTGKQKSPHPLLAHLRGPGPHVRGCHVVDLLLGKM